MTRLNISHVRTHLREVIEQVRAGEDVEIIQNGLPVAVLVHPDRLRPRVVTPNTLRARELASQLEAARACVAAGQPLPPLGTIRAERAEELARERGRERQEGK